MAFLLGIDIGTSSTKVALCDASGGVRSTATSAYPVSQPRPGWSEQDPRDWFTGTVRAIRDVLARHPDADVAAVGFSGQMHGAVLLDRAAATGDGRDAAPLRAAILWNDQRTSAQCAQIESALGGRRALVERAGNAALPGFTLPKLLWVREHEPAVFQRVRAVVLPKDYVRFRLTARLATDVGDGAGMLAMDVDRRAWSPAVLDAVGLDAALLPEILESAAPAGAITPWAAEQTGLRPGTPVVAGSGDNMAGAVGAGVVEPGLVLATLGTSGVVYAHADRPLKDRAGPAPGRTHTMCAADGTGRTPGHWCVTGCMLSAGGALQWVHDRLFPEVPYERLLAEASAAPPGAGGLVFLPYLTGERCPHPDPEARGGWIGLTSRHTRAHLVRAVLEGVTFGMGDILDLVAGLGVGVETVRLGGGGAADPFWRQLQADVYGRPVALTAAAEGPALGAALLAGVGAGVWDSVAAACREAIVETERREPDTATAARYAEPRACYGALYRDLADRFGALGRIDAGSVP